MVQNFHLSSGRQLLIDTNAIIYFLTGQQPYLEVLVPLFQRVQAGSLSLIVSVITEAELLVRPERDQDGGAKERISDLLSEDGIFVINVERRIARRAAALRGKTRIRLADAIIIATALETGCEAIVGNDGEWARKLIDIPFVRLDDIVEKT